jgi:pyruvate,water dikinase
MFFLRSTMLSLNDLTRLFYQTFSPGKILRETYDAFRTLLDADHKCHEQVAVLEKLYHEDKRADFYAVIKVYEELARAIPLMIQSLERMAQGSYPRLSGIFTRIDSAVRAEGLRADTLDPSSPLVLSLDSLSSSAEKLVGGKAANLSRIKAETGLPVPKGFAITSRAYHFFCEANKLYPTIASLLADLDIDSPSSLEETSQALMNVIRRSPLPPDVERAIRDALALVFGGDLPPRRCAVRSSAVGEDGLFSFAGQFKTVLNAGPENLVEAYKEVIASKYSVGALLYRVKGGFLDQETPMAVLVIEMLDPVASGIVYSQSPLSSQPSSITVYSVWGLGELLVKGAAAPDRFEIARHGDSLRLAKKVKASQDVKMVLSRPRLVETVGLDPFEKEHHSLSESTALELAAWSLRLESCFGGPQDVEWCLDRAGNLYVLQSRPLRTEAPALRSCEVPLSDIPNRVLLSGGERAASGIGTGTVFMVSSPLDLKEVPKDSVLVSRTTSPKWTQVISHVKAVVTDVGSVAGHFASVAREWGVPALVNTGVATQALRAGDTVTVDADHGIVFDGVVERLFNPPCDPKAKPLETPFRQRLRRMLDHISPLHLTDPDSHDFVPEKCETLHDLLRFIHEKAVREMFSLGGKGRGRVRGARKLVSDVPITLYMLDLGGGARDAGEKRGIHLENVENIPLRALWRGLSRPDIVWSSEIRHFDWDEFDRQSAGIIRLDSQVLASFALLSSDYLNINVRFGYHFVVIDTLCRPIPRENYISFRFGGGGADLGGRLLRAAFLGRVLEAQGFETRLEGDTIDATFHKGTPSELEARLEVLGFLLGFTRLMDMRLKNTETVDALVREFLEKAQSRS